MTADGVPATKPRQDPPAPNRAMVEIFHECREYQIDGSPVVVQLEYESVLCIYRDGYDGGIDFPMKMVDDLLDTILQVKADYERLEAKAQSVKVSA